MTTFAVINVGSGAYSIDGNSNPTLNLVRGNTYTFNVNAAGHPFWIKTAPVTGTGSAYNDGVTNNGVAVGTISFTVPLYAPSTLYYICQIHSSMQGILSISGNAAFTETLTDSLTLSDSLSLNSNLPTSLTDSFTLSDSLNVGNISPSLDDNFTPSDTLNFNTTAILTDNSTPNDSLSVRYIQASGRIKDKVSELINNQFPEFIRSDYTTFVAFLKYYYKFLEQDQGALELVQNAKQYGDIDKTTESFVKYFITNYANDLPLSLLADKSLLIKRIEGLYKAKGSQLSIETLFKVLYNTQASTRHPYDFVLRTSDGKWSLRTSLRVLKTSGNTDLLQDRFLNLSKNNIKYQVEIVRVKSITGNLFEIFYKSNVDVPFEINDEVEVQSTSGIIFTGIVKPTTVSYKVVQGGTGFRVDQIFNVSVGGLDTLVRILKVGPNGSIQSLKIVSYGYNFTNDISITLNNNLGVAAVSKYFNTTAGGFLEQVTITRPHTITDPTRYFLSNYVDPFTYTQALLSSTTTSSQQLTSSTLDTSGVPNLSDAIINFSIGAIARYPGEYLSTQGFLSEPDVRLQDKNLYQPFAYQIESDLDISVFYNLVKKLVHQAGTNLFVNRVISNTANLSANVSVQSSKNVESELNSVFTTLETVIRNTSKLLTDSANVTESSTFVFTREPEFDTVTLSESIPLTFNKVLDDSVTLTDLLPTTTPIINDLLSTTESGGGVLLNYADSTYFLELYVGETIFTIT